MWQPVIKYGDDFDNLNQVRLNEVYETPDEAAERAAQAEVQVKLHGEYEFADAIEITDKRNVK